MRQSPEGEKLLKRLEGLSRVSYWDNGAYSVGYGHRHPSIKKNEAITIEKAEEYYRADVKWASAAVNRYVKVPLTQPQFDALVSIAYNIGGPRFRKSEILKTVNAKRYQDVPEVMVDEWPTVKRRRQQEAEMWMKGTKTMGFKLTDSDLKKLARAHPDLRKVFLRAAEISPHPFKIQETTRTVATQRKYIKRGVSKTMNSRHLTGHAVDAVPLHPDGKPEFRDWKLYYALEPYIKQAAKDVGVRVEWGGNWRSFKDGPHWQLPWKTHPKTQKFARANWQDMSYKEPTVLKDEGTPEPAPKDEPETEGQAFRTSWTAGGGIAAAAYGVKDLAGEVNNYLSTGEVIGMALAGIVTVAGLIVIYRRWVDGGKPSRQDIFA